MDSSGENRSGELVIDGSIDICGEVCPMTFILTKKKLDELETGQHLEVKLPPGEPMRNIPIQLKEEGHKILKVIKGEGFFKLIVEKS